ncbi:hypothetical protein [Sulfurovum sp. NBC37-1]|uniref:hypothetical protein n=1 Tax=Sulfurovum sp. (strain NBC37-1) TaxID=387093 RepID=UPI0001587AD0|nr:hypothetical protein [Sulfurovum sp. NBC37-1]BAF72449.1 hypothetical protein SUN_1498 [Sulfurovum sp. NBC37-1]
MELLKKGSTLEAQEQIMSLREGALELQEENQELKSKVRELEEKLQKNADWSIEKNRYTLVSPWGGPAQAYALKQSDSNGEEPHLLCSNCFNNSKKAILNPAKKDRWVIMVCPICNSSIDTGYREVGATSYAEEYIKSS